VYNIKHLNDTFNFSDTDVAFGTVKTSSPKKSPLANVLITSDLREDYSQNLKDSLTPAVAPPADEEEKIAATDLTEEQIAENAAAAAAAEVEAEAKWNDRNPGLDKVAATPEEFWIDFVKTAHNISFSGEIAITATLTIYGISGIEFGDNCKINYLPKPFRDGVYFRIIGIKHSVGETWDTELTMLMRNIPADTLTSNTGMTLDVAFLKSKELQRDITPYTAGDHGEYLALKRGEEWYDRNFTKIKPVMIHRIQKAIPKYIKYIFECTLGKGATQEDLNHILWSRDSTDALGNAVRAIKRKLPKKPSDGRLNIEDGDCTYIGKNVGGPGAASPTGTGWVWPNVHGDWGVTAPNGKRITGGFQVLIKDKLTEGKTFYLVVHNTTSLWTVWPTDPSNSWTEIDNLFALVEERPPLPIEKPIPNTEVATADQAAGDQTTAKKDELTKKD
jgi:hypothetical protein